MADTKISNLPAVTDVLATDEYVLARSGVTNKIDAIDLAAGLGTTTDGWVSDANGWTYATASTFTISGDHTAVYQKGTRLKFTQTTVKYGVVASSSFGGGNTTVTIAVNTDYVLANAAISDTFYSYQLSPQGYPDWFTYTPTYVGFSSAPASGARFKISGRTFTLQHTFITGTSNATSFTISVPVTCSASVSLLAARTQNNSLVEANPGLLDINATQSVVGVYRTGSGTAWTASGTKGATFEFSFAF